MTVFNRHPVSCEKYFFILVGAGLGNPRMGVSLVEGDGVTVLPDLCRKAPPRAAIIVVYHTHVANQFSDTLKHGLTAAIQKRGAQRNVGNLYNHMGDDLLHLDLIIDGVDDNYVVGQTNGHGRWFDWILPQ